MAAWIYAASQDPKRAGWLFLGLGALFLGVGVWLVFAQGGALAWVALGAGALIAGTGWLLRKGIG
ncbi:MAG TPA: hypothetical protein VML53_06565 [Thermoplasmata archaeon]|nr:hypothetical protein [Thermoplasmata archaeon]